MFCSCVRGNNSLPAGSWSLYSVVKKENQKTSDSRYANCYDKAVTITISHCSQSPLKTVSWYPFPDGHVVVEISMKDRRKMRQALCVSPLDLAFVISVSLLCTDSLCWTANHSYFSYRRAPPAIQHAQSAEKPQTKSDCANGARHTTITKATDVHGRPSTGWQLTVVMVCQGPYYLRTGNISITLPRSSSSLNWMGPDQHKGNSKDKFK